MAFRSVLTFHCRRIIARRQGGRTGRLHHVTSTAAAAAAVYWGDGSISAGVVNVIAEDRGEGLDLESMG